MAKVIECGGNAEYSLKQVFQSLSNNLKDEEKNFYYFKLTNTVINQLPDNTFEDITFGSIFITEESALKHINTHAFTATNHWVEKFSAEGNNLENNPPVNDLFIALSSMNNLWQLSIANGKLTEIPSDAFQPINGPQKSLNYISFYNMQITKIGDRPFWNLPSLKSIELGKNKLNFISSRAFEMKSRTAELLEIHLDSNQLNSTSFEIEAFLNTQSSVHLILKNNTHLTYLDEKVFKTFFNNNPQNKLTVDTLDCEDCKSNWLKENNKYMEQMAESTCITKKNVSDKTNFLQC
jgi:hypothetical protein